MGVIYFVACQKCRVMRDIDKCYGFPGMKTREEVIELSKREWDSFRAVLLAGFMFDHAGHPCTILDDLGLEWAEYTEEGMHFWTDPPAEKKD